MTYAARGSARLINHAVDTVAAYVSNNSVQVIELPILIASTYAALAKIVTGVTNQEAALAPVPAVAIRKSISNDYIVCLEDGKNFKSLRRHLNTAYNLTPDQYRAKWNLPPDYPMVAPGYAKARSELAKSIGLGRKAEAAAKPKTRTRETSV